MPCNSKDGRLSITATLEYVDGSGGILGFAGPTGTHYSCPGISYRGVMTFDSADVDTMEARGSFEGVILHEMGHVIGVGYVHITIAMTVGTATMHAERLGRTHIVVAVLAVVCGVMNHYHNGWRRKTASFAPIGWRCPRKIGLFVCNAHETYNKHAFPCIPDIYSVSAQTEAAQSVATDPVFVLLLLSPYLGLSTACCDATVANMFWVATG